MVTSYDIIAETTTHSASLSLTATLLYPSISNAKTMRDNWLLHARSSSSWMLILLIIIDRSCHNLQTIWIAYEMSQTWLYSCMAVVNHGWAHTTRTSSSHHLPPHPGESDPHNDQRDNSLRQKTTAHRLDFDISSNIWGVLSFIITVQNYKSDAWSRLRYVVWQQTILISPSH